MGRNRAGSSAHPRSSSRAGRMGDTDRVGAGARRRPNMVNDRDERHEATPRPGSSAPRIVRHAVQDQEVLWRDFLAMARAVVESLAKGVEALCEGRLEVVPEVKD